ncbi:MAG: DUF1150 family protein [Aestuariivirga sp.]
MNAENVKKTMTFSEQDFARLGGGALAYIREIQGKEATRLLGHETAIPQNSKLFCLYHANGMPVSISETREAAIGSAFEHELMPMSVH